MLSTFHYFNTQNVTLNMTTTSPRTVRIVIIEDGRVQAELLRNNLVKLGFEVVAVLHDLEAFKKSAPNLKFDLAIVDLRLGEKGNKDGWEIVRFLQDRGSLILINTGYEEKAVWKMIAKTDKIDIVGKPSPYPKTWLTRINTHFYRNFGDNADSIFRLPSGDLDVGALTSAFFFRGQRYKHNHVCLVETKSGGLEIHAKRGITRFSDSNFKQFFKACTDHKMMRIHKSYAVNLGCVVQAGTTWGVIELPNGREVRLNVGSIYRDAWKKAIGL